MTVSLPSSRPLRHVATALTEVVLVCRKCSRKLGRGFGPQGDQKLAKALRGALSKRSGASAGKRKGRRARFAVIEVDCLDLCPRDAIVALRADRPGDWVLVPEGTAMGEVMDNLGLRPLSSGEVP